MKKGSYGQLLKSLLALICVLNFIYFSNINVAAEIGETNNVIYEIKGEELAGYANTGKSLDNMRPFSYGWMLHSKDKTEREHFVEIIDGCIVFEAGQDEFLPGGYLFKTSGVPGLIYTLKGLKPDQLFKIAYVINIDPISKDFTNRLMNFEFTHSRKNISIESDFIDSWGDNNECPVPASMLGKDLQIVFNVKLKADNKGEYELRLINYSGAHYPLFFGERININLTGNNAPFRVTIKAVQFLAETAANGVHEIDYDIKTPVFGEYSANYVNNLEKVTNGFYTDSDERYTGSTDITFIIAAVAGILVISLIIGGIYFCVVKKEDLRIKVESVKTTSKTAPKNKKKRKKRKK